MKYLLFFFAITINIFSQDLSDPVYLSSLSGLSTGLYAHFNCDTLPPEYSDSGISKNTCQLFDASHPPSSFSVINNGLIASCLWNFGQDAGFGIGLVGDPNNVNSDPNYTLSKGFTISAWFNIQGSSPYGQGHIMGFGGYSNGYIGVGLITRDGAPNNTLEYDISIYGGASYSVTLTNQLPINSGWHNCIIVGSDSTYSLYVDGSLAYNYILDPSFDVKNIIPQTSIHFLQSPYGYSLNSYLDEVSIWLRPLSKTEIKLYYNNGKGTLINHF
jgi:Concanavalin A-like lectin/glucanases superfamily